MSTQPRIAVNGDTCQITLRGEIDFANADQMTDWLIAAIDKSPCHLFEIDLGDVGLVDSSGIGCFVMVARYAESHGARVRLARPMAHVRRVFDASGVSAALGLK